MENGTDTPSRNLEKGKWKMGIRFPGIANSLSYL